jgi:hypothetical protein
MEQVSNINDHLQNLATMGKIVYDELHRKTGLRQVLESHYDHLHLRDLLLRLNPLLLGYAIHPRLLVLLLSSQVLDGVVDTIVSLRIADPLGVRH